MQIAHFHRKKNNTIWSIEKIFAEIRTHIKIKNQIIPVEMPHSSLGLLPRIKNTVYSKKHQADINHITGDIHYIALGLQKKKTLLTVHDLGFMDQYTGLARYIMWLFWIYLPVRRVKYITAISNATKVDILRYVSCKPEKISVIPDFVSPKFTKFPREFNQNYPVVLQIGAKFNKNVERLFQALEGISCHLIVVGALSNAQKELLQKCRIEYENKNNLTELEIIDLYRNCDIVTFCSLLEGFGLPILEAQVTGRPVITSNISSMPEVAGNGACIVDPYDVLAIRNGILKIINDPLYRNNLIQNGFENAKKFSVQAISEQYAALYQQIAEELNISN